MRKSRATVAVLIVGVAAATVYSAPAAAQLPAGCIEKELPNTICTPGFSTTCCPDPSASGTSISDSWCSLAYYWVGLQTLGITQGDIERHNIRHGLQLETFTNYPAATGIGGSTWARHYVSAFLVHAVNYVYGQTWHHPVRDYAQTLRADESPFHSDYSQIQVSEDLLNDGALGSFRTNLLGRDTIRLSCEHFGGSLPSQTATMIHEAWHSVYGSHDYSTEDAGGDIYRAHGKREFQAGEINKLYASTDGAVWYQSTRQTEFNFVCDVLDSPQNWVQNRTLTQARAGALLYNATGLDRLLDPAPGISCGDGTLLRPPSAPIIPGTARQRPRSLRIIVDGEMLDGVPLGSPDRTTIALDTTVPLSTEPGFHFFSLPNQLAVDDDTEFRFFAGATLIDNDTVEIRFQGEFYEDPPDCEGDTALESRPIEGQQCLGLQGVHRWRSVTLSSLMESSFPYEFNLDNCWDDDEVGQCEDSAVGTIRFILVDG